MTLTDTKLLKCALALEAVTPPPYFSTVELCDILRLVFSYLGDSASWGVSGGTTPFDYYGKVMLLFNEQGLVYVRECHIKLTPISEGPLALVCACVDAALDCLERIPREFIID